MLLLALRVPVPPPQEGGDQPLPVAAQEFFLGSSPNGERGVFLNRADGMLVYWSLDGFFDSADGGRTWSALREYSLPGCPEDATMRDAIRLRSGRWGLLAVVDRIDARSFPIHRLFWWTSADEGRTWEGPVCLNPSGQLGVPYSGGALLQTSTGRIVLPVRNDLFADTGEAEEGFRGRIEDVVVEGTKHALVPEFEAAFCYLSDDEGRTWSRSSGDVVVWKDGGEGGQWSMDEPSVVEAPEGRLCLYGRTTLGRLYRSLSTDDGEHWSLPEPTELASSCSPCRIVRVPGTADLLCVWNQLSGDEIRRGFWRGRLSAALSSDHGETWHAFRVIDVQGVPAVGRIVPEPPALVRPARDVGELPRDFGEVTYPTIGFHGDDVLLRYRRRVYWPQRKNSDRLVVIPRSWFHD